MLRFTTPLANGQVATIEDADITTVKQAENCFRTLFGLTGDLVITATEVDDFERWLLLELR